MHLLETLRLHEGPAAREADTMYATKSIRMQETLAHGSI